VVHALAALLVVMPANTGACGGNEDGNVVTVA
jgi:hypothetical protein